MSLSVNITITDPRPIGLEIAKRVTEPQIRRVMGRAIATKLRRHFSKLDSTRRNRLGGARTHFYSAARRGIHQPELVADGVKVAVDSVGIAQRYYGGVIEATRGKALTIPVHPAAYGHRAREFGDLKLIPSKSRNDLAFLARPNELSAHGIGEVYYLLCKRVKQDKDPSVLPTDLELYEAARDAGDAYIASLIDRGNN